MADPQPSFDPDASSAWWARFTLIGGILAAALLALAPLGYRLGVLGVGGAVQYVPMAAISLSVVTLLFAIVGAALILRGGLRLERGPVLFGGALALVVLVMMGAQLRQAFSVPPIHDISTDPVNPPRFDAVVAARGADSNPLDYDADKLAAPTAEAYPWVQPIRTQLDAQAAFERSLQLVEEFGWEVVSADAGAGRIEATVTTFFYGFKDDVVIRIRPLADGSIVDLRSVSRVGVSDLGANAKRIGAFITRFEQG